MLTAYRPGQPALGRKRTLMKRESATRHAVAVGGGASLRSISRSVTVGTYYLICSCPQILTGVSPHHIRFIASLPVILGAVILWPLSNPGALSGIDLGVLALATGASFVAGLAAMVVLRRIVLQGRLRYFSYYLWTIGAITMLWQARGLLGL